MTKGFVNLNRFKYGRAIKQSGKRKSDLQSKKKSERGPSFIAKKVELTFGSIVVEGKKYRRDVLIFPDGTVKSRKTGLRGKI